MVPLVVLSRFMTLSKCLSLTILPKSFESCGRSPSHSLRTGTMLAMSASRWPFVQRT